MMSELLQMLKISVEIKNKKLINLFFSSQWTQNYTFSNTFNIHGSLCNLIRVELKIVAYKHTVGTQYMQRAQAQGCKGKLKHTFTLAADLKWARLGLGGRMKQDRKCSSQMEM